MISKAKNKILHVITGLNAGGAEFMLYNLLSRLDKTFFSSHVVSLTNKGLIAERIETLDVPVQALSIPRGMPDPRGIWRLRQIIQKHKPDIIQTWMYHADLIGGLAAKISRTNTPVVWGIHHTNLDPKNNKKTTLLTAKACALLSKSIPRRIVCCSKASAQVHAKLGYASEKMLVIPNGFDLEAFRPARGEQQAVRHSTMKGMKNLSGEKFGLDCGMLLVGMVARFNPQKDHRNLVQAAGMLKEWGVNCCFVLCGNGVDQGNAQLTRWISEAGVEDRFFLLGSRDDMPQITMALDVVCLSSAFGEAFPLVLGEAMACEVPCVATDVGDSADIVGDTGRIVPPRDPVALAGAIRELVEMGHEGRENLGKAARERVRERFELGSVVREYEGLYRSIVEEDFSPRMGIRED
jgi:glycosyltransferase involved in cell wall biosynthesis